MKTKPCTVLPYPWHWVAPFTNDETLFRLVNKPSSLYGFVAVTYGGNGAWVTTYPYKDRFQSGAHELVKEWKDRRTFEEAMLWVETMIATGAVNVHN